MDVEKEIEELKAKDANHETSFKSVCDMFEEIRLRYKTDDTITQRAVDALKKEADKYKDIKEFMERIDHALRGNGKMGIQTKLSLVWYACIGLIAGVAFLYVLHLPK